MYTAELLSELVKTTTEEHPNRKKRDTNVYGTTVEYDGKIYVRIDGSDMLTPVYTTSELGSGERVVLRIKDHTATVTGNLTNPSASKGTVDNRVLQVETNFNQSMEDFKMNVVGSFVSTDDLDTVKQELTDLTDAKISEANKTLRSDFDNLETRIQTSQTMFEQDLTGFKTTVAGTYLTKQEFEDSDVGSLASSVSSLEQDLTGFKSTVVGTYVTKDDYDNNNKTFNDKINELTDKSSTFDENITNLYERTDSTDSELQGMKTTISGHETSIGTLEQSVVQFQQDLTGFKTTVAGTYLTKQEFEDSDVGSLSASMSNLEQDLTGFKSTVAATYVTNTEHQTDLNNVNADISDLNTNLTNAKKDIEANTKNVGTLQTSVSTLEQDMTGFKSTVASTYVTNTNYDKTNETFLDAINSNATNISNVATRVSQIEQTADKINFIVASGDSASSMTLTDEFYNVVSENITLSADHISVEGLTTVNENFKILTDGTCEVTDLVVTNSISVNNIIAEGANIPWIIQSVTRDMQFYIDANHVYTDEEYTIESEDTFASFADLMSVCPRNLNGYQITIDLLTDVTENASLYSLNNGTILINMKGHSLKGYIYGNKRTCRYLIYGDDSENVGSSTRGKIIPGAVGYLYSDYRYAVMCQRGWLGLYDVDLYGGTDSTIQTKGVMLMFGADGYLSNIRAVNDPHSLVRLQASSHAYISSSSGNTTSTTFQSVSGSIMQMNPGTHAGRSGGTAQKYTANNGLIFDDGVTYSGSTITDSESINDNTDTNENKTSTLNSDYGDSYRTTIYNNWKKDNTVRQGQYGYGINKGCWFFGNDLYEVLRNAKSIESMKITIRRQAGGISSAVTHHLRAHTYKNRPSGEPSLLATSVLNKTFSLKTGSSTTITLTSSEISALKSNGARGFGLYTTSTSTSDYSVCSGKCTIKIKYKG